MTGLARFQRIQGRPLRQLPQIPSSYTRLAEAFPSYERYGRASAAADIFMLHNVYIAEELIHLIIESNAGIIANLHWTENVT